MITTDTEHTPTTGLAADIAPIYDRLLIRVIEDGDRTRGGLVVPQLAKSNTPYLRGEVLAAGHGRIAMDGKVVPLEVREGDVVIFFRKPDEQIVFPLPSGQEALVIREPHVMLRMRGLPQATGVLGADGRELVS